MVKKRGKKAKVKAEVSVKSKKGKRVFPGAKKIKSKAVKLKAKPKKEKLEKELKAGGKTLKIPQFKNAKIDQADAERVFSRFYARGLPERVFALNALIEGGRLNDIARRMAKKDWSERFKNLKQTDITGNITLCAHKVWRIANYIVKEQLAEIAMTGDDNNPRLQVTKVLK